MAVVSRVRRDEAYEGDRMRARESNPVDPAPAIAAAAAFIPVVLVSVAALFHGLRIPAFVFVVAGFLVVRRAGRLDAAAWAATIPVALILMLALLPRPPEGPPGAYCTTPLQPFTVYRIFEASLALAALAILVPAVRAGTAELGLRLPSRGIAAVGLGAAVFAAPVALVVAPPLSEPFFGPLPIRTDDATALIPALLYAVVNGVTEEIIYRGALLALLARSVGIPIAIVAQAVVFGLVHGASTDYVSSPWPVVAVMIAGGLVAGVAAVRTRSLLLPIALHIAFDIPLYYGNACLTR
jgi:membrane protease YdiL (CAAX protease family)